MAAYPTYPNAPIIEAILDIQVSLPQDISLEHLLSLHAKIQQEYPEKRERVAFESSLKLAVSEKQAVTTGSGKVDGYLFRSSIQGKVVQSRLDGFTFNKLKPYESWRLFSTEAKNMWNYYRDIARPIKITRCSLRYINKIVIPLNVDTKEYFLTGPEISHALPQVFRTFFMRLEVPDDRNDSLGIINMVSQTADDFGLPIIFDIDVVKHIDISPYDDKLWSYLGALRNFKNMLFFESLTDKAKGLFK